jgi:hypothetical protein
VRLGVTYSNPHLDVMVEGSQPTILGAPTNAVATGAAGQLGMGASYRVANGDDRTGAFLKQAFVRFKNVGEKGNSAATRPHRVHRRRGVRAVRLQRRVAEARARSRTGSSPTSPSRPHSAATTLFTSVRATPRYNVTLMAGMPTEGVFQLDGRARSATSTSATAR